MLALNPVGAPIVASARSAGHGRISQEPGTRGVGESERGRRRLDHDIDGARAPRSVDPRDQDA